MITFKQFIDEEIMPTMPLAQFVKLRCSAYLKIPGATSGLLFRGLGPLGTSTEETINDIDIRWKIVTARKGRPAGDTPQEFSDAADRYFQEVFGWKARGDATFVSGDKHQADDYGDVYIVIPMGETKFVWSPKVRDLYTQIFMRKFGQYGPRDHKSVEEHEKFISEIRKSNYTEKDLEAAIRSKHEIALKCNHYVAIAISNLSSSDISRLAASIGIMK